VAPEAAPNDTVLELVALVVQPDAGVIVGTEVALMFA